MTQSNRREFIKNTSVAAAAASFVPYIQTSASSAPLSANDRLTIGCIGVGSMGTGDAHGHAKFGDIVAVCDVDSSRADKAKNDEKIGKGKAEAFTDYAKTSTSSAW